MQARKGNITKKHKCFRCGRDFARREHLDRHERSHTKEQPFGCNTCPKAFTRKDLLIRHQRLYHGTIKDAMVSDSPLLDNQRTFSPPAGQTPSYPDGHQMRGGSYQPLMSSTLADNGNQVWSAASTDESMDVSQYFALDDFDSFADSLNLPTHPFSPSYQPLPPLSDDLFSMVSTAETPGTNMSLSEVANGTGNEFSQTLEPDGLSRFGSRLPSLERDDCDNHKQKPSVNSHGRLQRVSSNHMEHIRETLRAFASVTPDSVTLPSRHALNRFVHGYFTGFHQHYPMFHLPTLKLDSQPAELVLAIASIGSQYCLEHLEGFKLFRLAKCVGVESQRRRESGEAGNASNTGLEREPVIEALQAARTFLLLTAVSMWSESMPPFHEALSMRSNLETLLQRPVLRDFVPLDPNDWEEWALHESIKRVTVIIYCFFNLQTMVFDVSPVMLVQGVHVQLPSSEKMWEAATAEQWRIASHGHGANRTFQQAYSALFKVAEENGCLTALSPLASHGLIHAIIQRIWLLHQAAKLPGSDGKLASLDVAQIEMALKRWQIGWERHEEASATPLGGHNPMSFTSTALLRLAYIRINMNPLTVLSSMSSWDPERIAATLAAMPAMKRSARATRAALHCAHALSIPIKLGLNFVVRTQVFFWSNQYALCSLESALFLERWLEAITSSNTVDALSPEESRLLDFVLQMVAETEYAAERKHLLATNKRLGAIVMRLWAKLFSGQGAWEIISLIHRCLVAYADLIERSDGV